MELKITGLKIDTGEEASPKAMAKAANLKAMKIEQEEDPEKKKRMQEAEKGDDHVGVVHGKGKKAEKEHKKRQKKAKGAAADPSGMVSGTAGNGE